MAKAWLLAVLVGDLALAPLLRPFFTTFLDDLLDDLMRSPLVGRR